MDTIRLIKINDTQLYIEINSDKNDFSKKIEVNFKVEQIKSLSQKISNDIFKNYVKNGILDNQFNQLKELSFELFNILDLYRLESYFKNQKSQNEIVHLHIIIDPQLNFIPFEILHDGKDFLSDYLILSREFTNSNFQNSNHKINSKEKFCVIGNPSESKDINDDIINEIESISSIINLDFNLRGPFKHRNVDKIELIRLLGVNNGLHFSGHYGLNGWKLFDEEFLAEDILKCSRAPEFIFSNSCGNYNESFIDFLNAFLNKGTKSIICSFGDLPSNKAAEFSKHFYKFFIKHNHNMGKALFLSRKEMIKKYGYKDLFWAFYQLYGSSLLKIKKVNILSSIKNKQNKYIINFSILIFILFGLYMNKEKFINVLDRFFNQDKLEIFLKSNISDKQQKKVIRPNLVLEHKSDEHYSINVRCDSIKFDQPYFSILDVNTYISTGYIAPQIIIDELNGNIFHRNSYVFKNDTLSLFLPKKDNFDRYELIFDDEIEYSVFLQQVRDELTLHIINESLDIRYRFSIDEFNNIKEPYHKDYFKLFMDTKPFKFPRDSFELIKNDFKFRNRLVLYIKKALID